MAKAEELFGDEILFIPDSDKKKTGDWRRPLAEGEYFCHIKDVFLKDVSFKGYKAVVYNFWVEVAEENEQLKYKFIDEEYSGKEYVGRNIKSAGIFKFLTPKKDDDFEANPSGNDRYLRFCKSIGVDIKKEKRLIDDKEVYVEIMPSLSEEDIIGRPAIAVVAKGKPYTNKNGKEVNVVVELKARFDEEANINYSEYLEAVGAQVVYGVVGLKTHAKMLLITRREGKLLKRYAHLSTGNYNASTARMYTDLSMMTADPALTRDVEQVFLHLASQSRLPKLEKIQMAPFHLQHGILQQIEEVAHAAASGKPAHIIVKMNSLTDERLAKALMAAAQQGVTIELIIRGACIIAAQSTGACENIRLRSVIGRFLEHTRVFYFQSDQNQTVWLSSADFMSRNMLRRVEIAWPVEDAQLRARVLSECLGLYLTDTANTWEMKSTTQYEQVAAVTPVTSSHSPHDAHHTLMLKYGRIG